VNLRTALVLVALSPVAASAPGSDILPTGVVTARAAEFSIPVAHKGPWRWSCAETADNTLEFNWAVSIKSASREYQFGFSFFKYPGTKEKAGPLDDLLRAGQASLWRIGSDGGGSMVRGPVVSATRRGGQVLIRLSDPAWVRLLFGDRPAVAQVLTKTADSPLQAREVAIEYRQ
jgi:hypothetical protein